MHGYLMMAVLAATMLLGILADPSVRSTLLLPSESCRWLPWCSSHSRSMESWPVILPLAVQKRVSIFQESYRINSLLCVSLAAVSQPRLARDGGRFVLAAYQVRASGNVPSDRRVVQEDVPELFQDLRHPIHPRFVVRLRI